MVETNLKYMSRGFVDITPQTQTIGFYREEQNKILELQRGVKVLYNLGVGLGGSYQVAMILGVIFPESNLALETSQWAFIQRIESEELLSQVQKGLESHLTKKI